MPYDQVNGARAKYRSSPKGRATAAEHARRYYHEKLKHDPVFKAKANARNRRNHYIGHYGLSPDKADEMKKHGCGICRVRSGKMNIDHSHSTGKVRGVLCNSCNIMVGFLEKADTMKESVIVYMKGGRL